jgi:hypothetical protein
MEKICAGCTKRLSLDQFNWQDKLRGILHSRCKSCTREQGKHAYRAKRDYYIAYNCKLRVERRRRNIERVRHYLLKHPCVDCGEADPVVLDFDHVSGNKTANISHLLGIVASWEKLEDEIKKCEVRCANCHRRKTAKEQQWYKDAGL